jgi:hypothetical protein
MLIAGLFNDSGNVVILTNYARDYVMGIHTRMPFVLTEKEIDDWINPKLSIHEVMPRVQDKSNPKWTNLRIHKVPKLVARLKNKTARNIMTIEEYQKSQADSGGAITSFFKFAQPTKSAKPPIKKVKIGGSQILSKE